MATLNDVISCYNELVDEVNGHTASIDKLTARLEDVPTLTARIEDAMASLTAKLSQLEARLDELVQEHDVMMDTISSLLAAPTPTVEEEGTVELKRVEKKSTVVEAPTLKRVEKKGEEKTVSVVEEQPAPAPTVVEEQPAPAPTVVEEDVPTPTPTPAPKPTVAVEGPAHKPTVAFQGEPTPALKRTPAPTANKRAPAPAPKTTEIQKRAFARQYMVEHGAKVEDLRNPERINETIASDEFTAWMNAR